MKRFKHFDAKSLDEAVELLGKFEGKAKIIAGGTDIIGELKDNIFAEGAEALINIKTISDLEYIKEENRVLRIGALTRLEDIIENKLIAKDYLALAQAARHTASPHIREMGTIAGNICQHSRCWYFRCENNRFPCKRKGGEDCHAEEGDNRYHSIFGDIKDCIAVHPSDTAPALVALGASVKTTKRVIEMDSFFQRENPEKLTVLDDDEIVIEIQIPKPPKNSKSEFIKFAIRKSIDFPLVNCAALVVMDGDKIKDSKVVLNAVCGYPYVSEEAEEYLKGKTLDVDTAESASELAVSKAKPKSKNEYKITIAKTLYKKTLLACK